MPQIEIRPASGEDAPLILRFIRELAEYERAPEAVVATVEDVRRSLFTDASTADALICEIDGEPVGFAVYFFNYSTWLGRKGLYLEDLYVTPDRRGRGAGTAMLRHLARFAVEQECGRFEWSVLDWNEPAIRFYESIGAQALDEWVGYRLEGDSLHTFAHENRGKAH